MRTENKLKMLFQKAKEEIRVSDLEKSRTLELLTGWADDRENDFKESEISRNQGFCTAAEASGSPSYFRQWLRILCSQIRYMDKKAWGADLMGNICIAAIPVVLRNFGAGAEDVTAFLMLASSLLGSISILVLSHLFDGGVGELSSTCYFSARQFAAQQMFGLGAVNLLTLAFLICFVGSRWETEMMWIGIYASVPFVVTVCVCMGVLQFERLRSRSYPVTAAGLISGAVFLVIATVPQLYCVSAAMIWVGALAAGIGVLAAEIRHLFYVIDKGEILCTDWN